MNDRRTASDTENGTQVSREDVRSYYSRAAVATQESLCCPVKYEPTDLSHIPKQVLEISYGCGSPVNRARLAPGETMVDLGSGGGIDCFIAAKLVGPEGRVIGIDMTDEMLNVARANAEQVSQNLGYNNLDFRQGFLESIPVEDATADLVTSNCVINLSVDKNQVFQEIHRILKPGGRFVIADIISDRPVPEAMRNNRELWGECVSGALTLDEFLKFCQQSRFHGFTVQKDYLWKVVEGIRFYSYILTGYKPLEAQTSCCGSETLYAIYSGPFPSVRYENQEFPLGTAVEVDATTAATLARPPYADMFNIIDPEEVVSNDSQESCCG